MNINLRITYLDGNSVDVSCTAGDIVRFEAKYSISVAALDNNLMFTHMLFLAWSSESRRKATALEFEEWADTVLTVEAGDSPK